MVSQNPFLIVVSKVGNLSVIIIKIFKQKPVIHNKTNKLITQDRCENRAYF